MNSRRLNYPRRTQVLVSRSAGWIAVLALTTMTACAAPQPARSEPERSGALSSPDTAPTATPSMSRTVAPVRSSSPGTSPQSGSTVADVSTDPVTRRSAAATLPAVPTGSSVGRPGHPIDVTVSGLALGDAKGVVRMCPPYPVAATADGMVDGSAPATGRSSADKPTPPCQDAVATRGLDIRRTQPVGANRDHTWGTVKVVGSWDGRVLTVTDQQPIERVPDWPPDNRLPERVPCEPPAIGWNPGPVQNDLDGVDVERAVGADFGQSAIGYPEGAGEVGPDGDLSHVVQVLVVGTTGDVPKARSAIRRVFGGNLCVVHATHSAAEIRAQTSRLGAAVGGGARMAELHIISYGGRVVQLGDETLKVDVSYESEALRTALATVGGPAVTVNSWLQPAG